jgi:transcriptional regulator with XRE-family HTH domain
MQTETKKGTYKCPEPEVLVSVVKELRTHLGWKQFALAHEAGVTVRTIERLEGGERMSDETFKQSRQGLEIPRGRFHGAKLLPVR